jgi:phage-related protein
MLAAFSWFMELLASADEHTLVFSDEGGYARRVVLECDPSFDEYEERGSVPLTFMMYDPYREQINPTSFTVRSGTPATFTVDHDLPQISITTTQAQRDSVTHLWGVRFDNGDMLRVLLSTALQTPVDIDVRQRKVLIGHEVSMLTLESDWPKLKAGTHTATIDVGSGSAAITIRERCL